MINCDPSTGACLPPETDQAADHVRAAVSSGWTVRYVGDPMCSWCWGMSPSLGAVREFCAAEELDFAITVGGLRAGGGDAWNLPFKEFLRKEWQHIGKVSGQQFSYTLLDLAHFDYDTEPACRAIVAFQLLQAQAGLPACLTLQFFSAVQRKFYVDGGDPKLTSFYQDICTSLNASFDAFRLLHEAPQTRQRVQKEFVKCRRLGVRSFPTILLEHGGQITPLAAGFASPQETLLRLRQALANAETKKFTQHQKEHSNDIHFTS
jgi:putative protein-disulfide isomerase